MSQYLVWELKINNRTALPRKDGNCRWFVVRGMKLMRSQESWRLALSLNAQESVGEKQEQQEQCKLSLESLKTPDGENMITPKISVSHTCMVSVLCSLSVSEGGKKVYTQWWMDGKQTSTIEVQDNHFPW